MRLRETGMSIIEMMVAVAIGMIGIIIIMQAYLTGENFNRSTLGEGSTQVNGMLALYTIERDMRTAGYSLNSATALNCGLLRWHYSGQYSANVAGGTLPNIRIAPVVITVDTAVTANPDAITVMYGTKADRMLPTTLTTFNAGTRSGTVDGLPGFATGDYVILANSGGCSLARVTGTVSASQTISFATTDAHNPATWSPNYPNYIANDQVINLGGGSPAIPPVQRTYFIQNGKLRMDDVLLTTGSSNPVDIVDNVVDMRAVYAKDDGASGGTANDGVADSFNNTTPATVAEWQQVIGIKLAVLLRNTNYEKPDSSGDCSTTTVRPTWSQGTFYAPTVTTVGSPDRCYQYRVYETTIPLRNMIWKPT